MLLQSLLGPLLISAILYFLIFWLFLPLYRRHRARYSQYLPLALTSAPIADASGLRQRVTAALRDFLPNFRSTESWLRPARERVVDADDYDADEELEDAVWDGMEGRRDALEGQLGHISIDRRRLSRELEEGFRDSSDDDDENEERVESRGSR
jgi:hypothetical protein